MTAAPHTGAAAAFVRHDRRAREAAERALSPAAARAAGSRGRRTPEPPDHDRTCFQVDRDRILHSKAFRRLKHKTQVFVNPDGDHYVTRLTHTLQVAQVARALAAALTLNEPLAEAIALGHDVGHTPFGHTGEEVLATYFPDGWSHAAQSVRIFEVLEDRNLTWEVRDGIRAHPWKVPDPPATAEGQAVRFADRIAYLGHDAKDALRAGILRTTDLPAAVTAALGPPGGHWIGIFVRGVVQHSAATGAIGMEPDLLTTMHLLREFMFERVYAAADQRRHKDAAVAVLRRLVDHLLARPDRIPPSYRDGDADTLVAVADYVAGMTDRFAVACHADWCGGAGAPALDPADPVLAGG